MSNNLRTFEWTAYGAIFIGLLSDLAARPGLDVIITAIVVAAISALLIWAAARRGKRWAGWIYFAITAIGVVSTIGDFWVGGPNWLREFLKPETVPTALERASTWLFIVLNFVAFYFFLAAHKIVPSLSRS